MESRASPGLAGGNAGSATVVITQHVRAGREDDYRPWQDKTIDAARGFDGFEGAEVHPPSTGGEQEWTVVYRFAAIDQLNEWLQSDVRERLIDEGRPFFDSPPKQEVLVGEPPAPEVITAVVSHDVLPGKEQDFERWQGRMSKAQEKFPGYMGGELFKPVRGVQEHWVSVLRYDTPEHFEQWYESDARKKLLDEGNQYVRSFDVHRIKSPFSGWFRFGAGAEAAIPNWKQAMTVLLGLYPTVMILDLTAGRWLKAVQVPGYLALFISNVLSVVILTWLVMPLLNLPLARWLLSPPANAARINVIGTAVVVVCYAASVAFFGLTFG